MRRILLLSRALGVAATALDQQFKWVDKDGRVQYGDTPPPGVKATRLRPPPPGSSSPPPAAAKKGEKPLSPEAAFRQRQQERAEAEKKAGEEARNAEQKRANCESAQAQVRQIQSGQRMATVNSAGARVILDDDAPARE